MAIIETKNLYKTFEIEGNTVNALNDINLSIEEGDIYGIIGMSGAGKSTLVRCLNFLERPSKGSVIVDKEDLGTLSDKDLRKKRSNIGMIFQSFNLLQQKSVIDNVSFPLILKGLKKKDAREKARELLARVNLSDKEKAYPSQLSGGQCQRVAIARALATNPKILLLDEATSALDPKTTAQILDLLKEINKDLGITMVVITHSMDVVKNICNRLAIIDEGRIVEEGFVKDIFSNPRTEAARNLINKETKENENENVICLDKAKEVISGVKRTDSKNASSWY
ncbi:MAG: ATP-binding cassette domain-containing protein [Eubacterium sp.]|nr:ATP-binding cassette domain-containing protein [Eubacterium sp.]